MKLRESLPRRVRAWGQSASQPASRQGWADAFPEDGCFTGWRILEHRREMLNGSYTEAALQAPETKVVSKDVKEK